MTERPVEPHADIRAMAATTMRLFVAFTEVGFTPPQALKLIATLIRQEREQ